MNERIRYSAAGARRLLKDGQWSRLEKEILTARDAVLADVELLKSAASIPTEKQPLDAGFIELPQQLLADYRANGAWSLLGKIETAATRFAAQVDRMVVLGIGGSFMGARALFEALCHPYHNELTRRQRSGIPRISFEGNNLDNSTLQGLLQLLPGGTADNSDISHRWGIVVISKSGGTLETAVAFRIFREALEDYYGPGATECTDLVVPITGEQGRLRKLAQQAKYPAVFPIPDHVGGRFSIFTAVGLFPAAVLGINVEQLLRGAADMTERFRSAPLSKNPVLSYTAVCHHLEVEHGINIRVLSTWGKRLESLGLWYDQLLAESLGKDERGATPITCVNTRDLHSRGQQHQQGTRDKLITNVYVDPDFEDAIAVPAVPDDCNHDELNKYCEQTLPDIFYAAFEGTNQAYEEANRPTADIILPHLDAYCLGQLLQMFMLATAVEGRLKSINPYGQPGVEAYKRNMTKILEQD